jgi:hypothetical protein
MGNLYDSISTNFSFDKSVLTSLSNYVKIFKF